MQITYLNLLGIQKMLLLRYLIDRPVFFFGKLSGLSSVVGRKEIVLIAISPPLVGSYHQYRACDDKILISRVIISALCSARSS